MTEDEQTYYTWYGQYEKALAESYYENFSRSIVDKGLAHVFGLMKGPEETDEQLAQRLKAFLFSRVP